MEAPQMKDTLAKATMSVVVSKSPAEFQKFVQEQAQKWNKVVLEHNIKVE